MRTITYHQNDDESIHLKEIGSNEFVAIQKIEHDLYLIMYMDCTGCFFRGWPKSRCGYKS